MRLIDADALIEQFNEKCDIATALVDEKTAERFHTFCVLADAVEDAPTIDAVPVVRCKDCEYWECGPDTKGEIYKKYLCDAFECGTTAYDFCSYGERRSE